MKNIKTKTKIFTLIFIAIYSIFVNASSVSAANISISCTSASISGRVLLNGATNVSVWFEWGTTSSLNRNTTHQIFNSDTDFSQTLSPLTENTFYYYRAVALSSSDSVPEYGDTKSFTTSSCASLNPSVTLTANPGNVSYNNSSTLTWNSINATSCNGTGGTNNWSGAKNISGSFNTGALTNTTSYNIVCTNNTGQTINAVATVYVDTQVQNNITVTLSVDRTNVNNGDTSNLQWYSNNATSCNGNSGTNNWSGAKSLSGSFNTGSIYGTTTFSIYCYGPNGGSDSKSVTIYVNPVVNNNQIYVTTNNATSVSSNNATLNGSVTNNNYGNSYYSTVWFEYGPNTNLGYTTPQNSSSIYSSSYNASVANLTPNTTYYFRAVGQGPQGLAYGSLLSFRTTGNNIIVYTNNQPTVGLSADDSSISYNENTTLRWYTTNATACNATGGSSGWAGTKSIGPASFYTGSLNGTTTYSITCTNSYGSATDSVTVRVGGINTTNPTTRTSLVLITSSVDRNQPILPTIDNSRPHPGDEINYTVNYQNIGTGAIANLTLKIILPYEVDYISSNPNNPTRSGNTLVFNLGTLKANGSGTVTIRVRVRDNIPAGTNLNFPATLSYIDPSGNPQSVNANVSAQVWSEPTPTIIAPIVPLGAGVFSSGVLLPNSLLGWLLLLILILILILLAKYFFSNQSHPVRHQTAIAGHNPPLLGTKRTTTTTIVEE